MTERQISQESGYSRGVVHRKLIQGRTGAQIIEAGKERQRRQTDAVETTKEAKGSTRHHDPEPGETYSAAQARKERSLADLRELEVKQKRGELLPRDEVRLAWAGMISSARSILLQLPAALAPRLTAGMSLAAREDILNVEIRKCLTALSEKQGA